MNEGDGKFRRVTDGLLFRFVVVWQSSRLVHYFEVAMCCGMCLGLAVMFDFGLLAPVVKFLPPTLKMFGAWALLFGSAYGFVLGVCLLILKEQLSKHPWSLRWHRDA